MLSRCFTLLWRSREKLEQTNQLQRHANTHFPFGFILWNCFGPLGRFLRYAEHSAFQRNHGNQISFFWAFPPAPGAGMGWGEPLSASIPPQHPQFPLCTIHSPPNAAPNAHHGSWEETGLVACKGLGFFPCLGHCVSHIYTLD